MNFLLKTLGHCPLPLLHWLGGLLGRLLFWIPNRRAMRTRANIAACLPQLSPAEQKRLAHQALIGLGKTALETPWLWFAPASRIRSRLQLAAGAELLQQARAQGKGVILLSPHLNWEAAVLFTGLQGPSSFLYKPQHPKIEPLLRAGRGRFGTELVHAVPGTVRQQLEQKLDAQQLVLILPDQDPPRGRGVYADFFGVPAHTPTLVSRLAGRSAAPVLLLQVERLAASRGFVLRILPAPADIGAADAECGAAAVNRAMQACIEPLLPQYMWNVPRFRHRPPGAAPIYRN